MPRPFRWPQRYFWKVLTTITVVSLGFLVIMLSTIGHFMVVPLGHRATDDLASIIRHAAEIWQHTPPEARPAFERRMLEKHQLVLTDEREPLPPSDSLLPYLLFLERSLRQQMGRPIPLLTSVDDHGMRWYWADVPLGEDEAVLRFGFPRSRIGVQPSVAFFVVVIAGFVLTFFTASLLARRLTGPVERLYRAARALADGRFPDPVPETGPEELAVLAREFNRMNVQVRELLAGRTTLLAGISHDLRTPLTQIQLALAMLPNEGGDPKLMAGIQRDIETMDRLIGQVVELGRELDGGTCEPIRLDALAREAAAGFRHEGARLSVESEGDCWVEADHLALKRVLSNLVDNALRYGGDGPVVIRTDCDEIAARLEVLDTGPGIPPEQREAVFQPFHRLENSRNSATGGSGLGLAIVRHLALANGWRVELLEREGGGVRARVELPAGRNRALHSNAPSSTTMGRPSPGSS